MKRLLTSLLLTALILSLAFTLTACGLDGTYDGKLYDLKFKGDNVTVITSIGNLEGTYEIEEKEDGKKTITFDFVDEDSEDPTKQQILAIIDGLLGQPLGFEEKDGTIKIGSYPLQMVFEKK